MAGVHHPDPAVLIPLPEFSVISAEALPYAAVPTMVFTLNAVEPKGHHVYAIALSSQIHIDPARRTYDPETRERLAELFGAPDRWGATTHSFEWARIDKMVLSFTGARAFEIHVPCTYDLEVASAKYFDGLSDGGVPLTFHFSGSVYYKSEDGELQITQIDWSTQARFHMPIAAWKTMITEHYPNGGWVRLRTDTLGRLHALRGARGLPTFDACVTELLDNAG